MNVSPLKLNQIYFKGYSENLHTNSHNNSSIKEVRTTTTAFMRNFPTLKFVRDYIKNTFPEGTDIAEFGCSRGEKPYSLLIMLDKYNKDKKYKVTGYDCPEVIQQAKQGNYELDPYNSYEQKIFSASESLEKTFFEYFDKVGDQKNRFGETLITPNKEKTDKIIKFKDGNILDVDKILEKNKSGVIIFQNALYHILCSTGHSREQNLENTKELFKKIYDRLPKKGIFVLGNYPLDHLYPINSQKDTILKYQNDKRIQVYENSIIHDYLREAGFKPIFYEQKEEASLAGGERVYLPSVWQK